MARTEAEQKRLERHRKKLGLIRLDVWLPKDLWNDIMKLIEGYKN